MEVNIDMGVSEGANPEFWTLHSNRLSVQVTVPGTVYRGTRFDWTGMVTQVTLDGRHTFCTKESFTPGKGTGGMGLCNEFGNSLPIGYEEAKVGEPFPKLGIGLLTRIDETAYRSSVAYPLLPFPIDVEVGESAMTFTAHPLPARGYAARLVKTLSAENNRLRFDYNLSNIGEKTILTTEYGHNFVNLDGHPIGPEYRLRLPEGFVYTPSDITKSLAFADGVMRWTYTPEREFYCRSEGAYAPGLQWELLHESGVGMRESVNFAPSVIALWGSQHVVSPEAFLQFELKPGETMTWTRELEFLSSNTQEG